MQIKSVKDLKKSYCRDKIKSAIMPFTYIEVIFMKGKRFLTSVLALATGCVCLFASACSELGGLLDNPGKEEHEHRYAYSDYDDNSHTKYCEDGDYSNLESHNYDDANDTTCNNCGHIREVGGNEHVHTGWAYVNTDDSKHWESPSCHPDVKRNEGAHVYENDEATTCKTCGHVRTVQTNPSDAILTYKHTGYESASFEWNDGNAANAKVEYRRHSGPTEYEKIDSELLRQKNSTTARADVLGLMGNALYDFKITTSSGKVETVESVKINAYDRAGSYAHFNYTSGVGAYNDNGTPKSGAVIVYVTESTKNSVKATIDGKTYTGIVSILQNAGTKTPLIVRVIGTVGAATWKEGAITYTKTSSNTDKDGNLLPSAIVDKHGNALEKRNYEQSELKGTHNDLDTSVYSELNGLSSKIKWDSSKQEFDSCWNDCSISGVKNVTVEGVGEDAKIFQWGFTFKNSSSIEVRNLTFDDYTEDACSFEASETGATKLSDFKSGNIWVHNNTFEEGNNYWDVCKEQDKHDGDGSTDFKGLKNITISYNVYNKTHKTGLIGGGNGHATANVTFHHNWYNGCKARLPLGRQANMHMYNNYYNATTGTSISLRAGAYALIENCYFDVANSDAVSIELQTDSTYGNGAAKLVNCELKSGKISNNAGSGYYYNGTDRAKSVTNDNKFSKTFDTDSSLFYYANGQSQVGTLLSATLVPNYVKQYAGVAKRSNNMTGGATDEPENPVPSITAQKGSWPTEIGTENTSVTQTLTFGSIFAIVPTDGHNNTWKTFDVYLQSLGDGVITIDLTNYTGSAVLEVVARVASASNTGRYYTITNTAGYSQQSGELPASDTTNTFTLACGYKYTLTCSNGLRFKSFKICAAY